MQQTYVAESSLSKSLNKSEVTGMMKEGKRSKSCSDMEVDLDRFSNLPDEIVEKILSDLPIEEGARTSVLSSKWRYKWATVPHLVFDYLCPAKVVDHVLLSHIGPITNFELRRRSTDINDMSSHMTVIEDMDRWILPISRHPIKEFILNFHALRRYKMPSCIFSCQELIHLHLTECWLKPPSTFEGFRSLKSLHFCSVRLAQDVLEHMIVGCPLLERLSLQFCGCISQLKINAPNLQRLFIDGYLNFSFVNALNLASVDIRFLILLVRHNSSNLLKYFAGLPKLQALRISGWFLKDLAGGTELQKLPQPCQHLKFLDIHKMNFGEVEQVSTAICLLRSSPALETLTMKGTDTRVSQDQADVGAVNSWLDNNRSSSFTQLRHVRIEYISGVEAELDFIRFLLISSPVLETLTVVLKPVQPLNLVAGLQNSLSVVRKLLRFRRASPDVEIINLDP